MSRSFHRDFRLRSKHAVDKEAAVRKGTVKVNRIKKRGVLNIASSQFLAVVLPHRKQHTARTNKMKKGSKMYWQFIFVFVLSVHG